MPVAQSFPPHNNSEWCNVQCWQIENRQCMIAGKSNSFHEQSVKICMKYVSNNFKSNKEVPGLKKVFSMMNGGSQR